MEEMQVLCVEGMADLKASTPYEFHDLFKLDADKKLDIRVKPKSRFLTVATSLGHTLFRVYLRGSIYNNYFTREPVPQSRFGLKLDEDIDVAAKDNLHILAKLDNRLTCDMINKRYITIFMNRGTQWINRHWMSYACGDTVEAICYICFTPNRPRCVAEVIQCVKENDYFLKILSNMEKEYSFIDYLQTPEGKRINFVQEVVVLEKLIEQNRNDVYGYLIRSRTAFSKETLSKCSKHIVADLHVLLLPFVYDSSGSVHEDEAEDFKEWRDQYCHPLLIRPVCVEDSCSICLDPVHVPGVEQCGSCLHFFHDNCTQSLRQCPLCRSRWNQTRHREAYIIRLT